MLNPIPSELRSSIPEIKEADNAPKTKAIIPVNLFGQSCDMEGILEVTRKQRLEIVEDSAQDQAIFTS